MISHVQTLKEKYLRGWERQATVILLASALLLTLHRYYSRRSFFNRHFVEHFSKFPLPESHPYYYWFLITAFTLFLVPALVAKFGTAERLNNYGFQLGNQKLGWCVTGAAWILMIPVVILAVIVYPPFVAKYPLCKAVVGSWQAFLLYQIAYGIYMCSWEFFFRGFMLFGLERKFGNYSILIQTIPFAVLHYSKPLPEALGSIIAGVLLGVLAFETRSFIYGAAIHWLVAMTMDVVAVTFRHFFM
ncbi:CPBP family intramembrane metalloprotease [Candidatus Poribacteria bacterium]|nr:CPBP family intramembrane metalloprotease [Candidatus Poribacteria bacterium]MYK20658.1 CPBP family intramembrane metalloprotease [Candidatus Poribacteria bacterium]